MKKLILIGGGGHCRSCIDVIQLENKYSIHGILDANIQKDTKIDGYPVLGTDELIDDCINNGYFFLITIGQIKNAAPRKSIYSLLMQKSANIATIVSPNAYVSKNANIGKGTIVLHGAIINSGVTIGENSIINTQAIIEHDTKIRHHTHISTGVIVNGTCTIGNESFIGSRSVILNNIKISDNIIIGAGSLVNRDIENPGTYFGNPAMNKNEK